MGTPESSPPGIEATTTDAGPSVVDGDACLSPATVSRLLSDRRRRYVLYYLLGCYYAASVEEITEQVAVWETETRAPEIPAAVYERVQTDVHHAHLPKLDEAGAVDHDPDSDLVTLADGTERLRVELYLAAEREDRKR